MVPVAKLTAVTRFRHTCPGCHKRRMLTIDHLQEVCDAGHRVRCRKCRTESALAWCPCCPHGSPAIGEMTGQVAPGYPGQN